MAAVVEAITTSRNCSSSSSNSSRSCNSISICILRFRNLYLCFLETTITDDHYVSVAVEKGKYGKSRKEKNQVIEKQKKLKVCSLVFRNLHWVMNNSDGGDNSKTTFKDFSECPKTSDHNSTATPFKELQCFDDLGTGIFSFEESSTSKYPVRMSFESGLQVELKTVQ